MEKTRILLLLIVHNLIIHMIRNYRINENVGINDFRVTFDINDNLTLFKHG
jgi:hypothetical protein